MPTPSATFTELVSTTLRNFPNEITDNVSKNNALWNRIQQRGGIETVSGGYEIQRALDYAENATYQRYSGYDPLNIQASDVLTSAKYDWAQAAVNVTASGREIRANSGKEGMINLVKSRLANARRTAANNMSVDLYSDGSLANQMGGLKNIVQTNGLGTVGGIDASAWSFWANQYREASGTNTVATSNIRTEMNILWLTCCRGADQPDLIVSSHDFFAIYEGSLQDLQRYTDDRTAGAGFQSLKYKGADVIFDTNSNFGTTAETMFFLNTDYLKVVVHRDANWSMLSEKVSVNQDAVVIPLIWQGNLVCTNRSLQGIFLDAT